jgi:hypothetical protein
VNLLESQFTRRGPTERSVAIRRYSGIYNMSVPSMLACQELDTDAMNSSVGKPVGTNRGDFLDGENM